MDRTSFLSNKIQPESDKCAKLVTRSKRRAYMNRSYLWAALQLPMTLLSILLLFGTVYLLHRMLFARPADLDRRTLEVDKCPACAGQSACPAFFRGHVHFTGYYPTTELSRQIWPSRHSRNIFPATMGLDKDAVSVDLRYMAHPSSPEAVDAAVCRRGLQHGFDKASEVAKASLNCRPHLSIYRWLPTNDLVDVSIDRSTILKASPFLLTQQERNKVNGSIYSSINYGPATRCVSDRLFDHLQRSFRERISFGAETRWTRFDELVFLFNLAIDPQITTVQAFSRDDPEHHWPFPSHIGACGRWIVQDSHGIHLEHFCEAPYWLRLRLLIQILSIVPRLERPPASPGSSRTPHLPGLSTSSTQGYTIYLGDFHLPSSFMVDPVTYNVTIGNLRHAVVVDTFTLHAMGFGNTDYHVPASATDFLKEKMISNSCHGNVTDGDAGGSTPPCMTDDHTDQLCQHSGSDHNYWAICSALLYGYHSNHPCANFLRDVPNPVMIAIDECSRVPDTRRQAHKRALNLLYQELELNGIP